MTEYSAIRRGQAWFLVLCILLITQGCARTFSGKLVDSENNPVSGALVYIEAYTSHTYAFTWSVSGDSGEVPAKGQPRLDLFMRPGARLMYCVLAPEQYPFIVNDREKVFKSGDISFVIAKKPLENLDYNPLLFHLDFPFESNTVLQKKLLHPENRILTETFQVWYKDAEKKAAGVGPAAMRKMEVLESLILKEIR
ncbi:MAG: hypothetical protein JXA71_02080 [Chitinispirillaceae bacterium]|nr:hypothetical protein [Chitinispirillaceae bacterium]